MTTNTPSNPIAAVTTAAYIGVLLASKKARCWKALGYTMNRDMFIESELLLAEIEALETQLWPVRNEGCWQPGKGYCVKDYAEIPVAMCPSCKKKFEAGVR